MAENLPAVSAQGLSAGYGKAIVVGDLSFELYKGEILTLIGRNGAGKSTVLRTIAAQLPLMAGEVHIGGRQLSQMNGAELSRSLSVLLTERLTAERMTCEEVVATGRYPYTGRLGILSDEDKEQVGEAMRLTGTERLAGQDFRKISDGQRQCVMIARAIAQQTELMLLDEPTSFLDIGNKLRVLALLRRLVRERGISVIMSLHELELAQRFSDRVLCISSGAAERIGTPEEIFTDEYIAALYGITEGGYNSLYGTAEPRTVTGEPQVFVIGGGGSGIAVYRRLQRQGVPFAAGVLHENDTDLPAARSMAAVVVSEKAYEPISEETFEKALAVLEKCKSVICCTGSFGTLNRANERLLEAAEAKGILIQKNTETSKFVH